MCHCLVCANSLAGLLALVGIRNGQVEGTLSETEHLRSNTDTAFVQNLDRNLHRSVRPAMLENKYFNTHLVSFTNLIRTTNQVLSWNLDAVEVEDTGRARSDAEFLLLLCNLYAEFTRDNKAGDALVSFRRVNGCKDEEYFSFGSVGNPHLGTGEGVV